MDATQARAVAADVRATRCFSVDVISGNPVRLDDGLYDLNYTVWVRFNKALPDNRSVSRGVKSMDEWHAFRDEAKQIQKILHIR